MYDPVANRTNSDQNSSLLSFGTITSPLSPDRIVLLREWIVFMDCRGSIAVLIVSSFENSQNVEMSGACYASTFPEFRKCENRFIATFAQLRN